MEEFGNRLRAALDRFGPLCVGIDPHVEILTRWGLSPDAAGLGSFAATVVEAFAGRVAVVKPQSAFFERFGARGIGILESTIRQFREAGTLVLLDVKRGDIGSTMAAYAAAYLDPSSPVYADAITVSPFLGFGSLRPALDLVSEFGSGLFVLTATSNPEGPSIQRAITGDGRTVAQRLIDEISQVNKGFEPMGSVGAVIGATIGAADLDLTNINGPILAPGLGAQGATAEDLRTVFGADLSRVVPSYSREILNSGPSIDALRAAADRAQVACRAVVATDG